METNTLEEILKKDVRFKDLEKRNIIFLKQLNRGIKKGFALLIRIQSMNKKDIVIPIEIENLKKKNFEIQMSLLNDYSNILKDGTLFESDGVVWLSEEILNDLNQDLKNLKLDEIDASTAIDKIIFYHKSWFSQREESLAKLEATQVKIKELLYSLEKA